MTTPTAPTVTPTPTYTPDHRVFVVTDPDGEDNLPFIWTAAAIARDIQYAAYSGEQLVGSVWLLRITDGTPTLTPVTVETRRTDFDGDDFATASVSLYGPDRELLAETGYRLDGRA